MGVEAKLLVGLDLDYTVLDTDAVFGEIVRVCGQVGIAAGNDLNNVRTRVEDAGETFDPFGYLSGAGVSEAELDHLAQMIGENADEQDYLYPDSHELLDTLDAHSISHIILTYGPHRSQLAKLRANQLDQRPYIITPTKIKGSLIASWWNGTGYSVCADNGQELHADTVLLGDDKSVAFEGLPQDCTGRRVWRKSPRPSQIGPVPENVITISSLAAITELIRARATPPTNS